MYKREITRRITAVRMIKAKVCLACALVIVMAFSPPSMASAGGDFRLAIKSLAGKANGEQLVIPDCAASRLKISPCGKIARSLLKHLNSRAHAFALGYQAAGYSDAVVSAVLDCGQGIYNPRRSRGGIRNSRHAYAEACDGDKISVNGHTFHYTRAVHNPSSPDRRFFVAFLDAWGTVGPGCIPAKGYAVAGFKVGCRPVMMDNCGVIDWRERGSRSQYASTYHLSYCLYSDPNRAYE